MPEYKLFKEIVARSQAQTWGEAKLEWVLVDVYINRVPDTCLCGHYPIIEICELQNKFNRDRVIVGNCCVKKFLGLPSDKIFQAIRHVQGDPRRSLNEEAIEHAHYKGWINDWERGFYFNIMRKRKLSDKQVRKKTQINTKVLHRVVNGGRLDTLSRPGLSSSTGVLPGPRWQHRGLV